MRGFRSAGLMVALLVVLVGLLTPPATAQLPGPWLPSNPEGVPPANPPEPVTPEQQKMRADCAAQYAAAIVAGGNCTTHRVDAYAAQDAAYKRLTARGALLNEWAAYYSVANIMAQAESQRAVGLDKMQDGPIYNGWSTTWWNLGYTGTGAAGFWQTDSLFFGPAIYRFDLASVRYGDAEAAYNAIQ